MPQLDFITFFNQIFCLVFFFSLFYLAISQTFVPFLSRITKLRSKKFSYNRSNKTTHMQSRIQVQETFANLLSKSCSSLSFFINTSISKRSNWAEGAAFQTSGGTMEESLFKAVAGLQNQVVALRLL